MTARLPTTLLALLLALGPVWAAATPAVTTPAAPAAAEDAADDHGDDAHGEEMAAGEIFLGLFKHIEPHALFGVWWGGRDGFTIVEPYETDASGEPVHLSHGHPVVFGAPSLVDVVGSWISGVPYHSAFREYYAARQGGGDGFLVYNINVMQWVAGALLIVFLVLVARAVGAHGKPRGTFARVFVHYVAWVRDEVVYKVMGKKEGRRFMPLFLTQFFFIWFMNMLGLFPSFGWFGGTATANLAVTAALAVTTFIWIHLSGIREHGFGKHFANFLPHGLPSYLVPLMIVVEAAGLIAKHVALTIRLFANMTGGHLVMLAFFGLIYLSQAYWVAALGLAGAVGIGIIEAFVAFVQAALFTYLSCIFVGAAVHPDH